MEAGMIELLITILVILLVCGAIVFIVRSAPFIEEPFKSWAVWVIMVIALLLVLLRVIPLLHAGL